MDKKTKILVLVMALGTFVVVIDNTIMNVSISALVNDLDTTVSGVQTAISLNALMMAAFVLMGGKFADIIGMKRTFFMGAILYVVGSLLASFSNNLAVFVLGWCAIQGFGAAMMLPNVNTIIRANIESSARGRAYGAMAGINALGTAVGPLIGGFLTTYFSWRWAFRLEVFILFFVLLMSKVIPKDSLEGERLKLDKIGVVWQAGAMIFIVVGTLAISDYGLFMAKQPIEIGGISFAPLGLSIVPFLWAAGALCLFMFVRRERKLAKAEKPTLVDLALFRIKSFYKGLNVHFLQVALVAGTTFSIPLFLQVTFGISAFQTGLILLGLTAGLITTAIGGARLGLRYLPKHKVMWGFVVAVLGLLILIISVIGSNSPWALIPGLFVYGLGLGLVLSQIVNLIMSAVKPSQTAEASGVNSTLETLGSSIGTAIIGTVLVVALTSGIGSMVADSSVFSSEAKATITSEMQTSAEVVSNQVLSETIQENGAYEEEAVRIYDEARQIAFIITLLFMAAIALICLFLSRGLPSTAAADLSSETG